MLILSNVFLLILLCDKTWSNDVNVYKSVEQCKKNERYDLDLFQCVECDFKESLLVPSTDRSTCICHKNAYSQILYDSSTQQPICKNVCKSCPLPEPPLCQLKFINLSKGNATHNKSIQVFYDANKNCSCDTKSNIRYYDYCILAQLLRNYQQFSSFDSERAVYAELKFIAFFCKGLRNQTACNHLANLCVMSFFNLAKNSPCSLFYISQASDAAVYSEEDIIDTRPFLFYRKIRSREEELDKPNDFSYDLKNEQDNFLRLTSVRYSLDGSKAQIGSFRAYHANFCNKNILSKYNSFKFGMNYETDCKFTLDQLMEKDEQAKHFYSIYLNYTVDKITYFHQVPVLIRNAFKFNEGELPTDWQLVKRFQLYDSHKLRERLPDITSIYFLESYKLTQFKMIRYVDSFELSVNIDEDNRISTPLIILHYKTIYVHRNSSLATEYTHKFSVRFTKSYDLDFYFELLLPLSIAIGFAFAILRTFNYKTRRNKEYYDCSAMCQFTLYLASNCANALFSVAVFVSLYVFFTITEQNTIKLLLPIKQQELIDVLIGIALFLKVVYLVFHFWKIINADIFFIDWERPKGYETLPTTRSNLDTPSVCSSTRSMGGDFVSAWRNFFVANEWIKISNKKKSSIVFQNLAVLIIYELMKNNSQTLRETNDKTLNLSLLLLLQLLLYAIQVCFNVLIIERIYGNPLQQFIDVCSTANISVFLLLHDSYGFYMHGRSPHGFSDVDMSSIIIQLQRESQNMCGKRGLLTGSDNQTYIILVPTDLRIYYSKLLIPFQKAASISQSHFEKEFSQNKSPDYSLEKTTAAYSNINKFFCAFIDHSIKDLDYIIKERTFIEVFLNCEFESYLTETKGTFYIDNHNSFGQVLLYGNDLQIFLCDLILFCFVFVLSDSPIIATFSASIIDQVFQTFFRKLIKWNVANKTLIDKRFLI